MVVLNFKQVPTPLRENLRLLSKYALLSHLGIFLLFLASRDASTVVMDVPSFEAPQARGGVRDTRATTELREFPRGRKVAEGKPCALSK